MTARSVIVDDHVLVRVLRGERVREIARSTAVSTTGLWYHRLSRALASSTVPGTLSRRLGRDGAPIGNRLLEGATALPSAIGLVSLRDLAWPMAQLLTDGIRLNVLGLEALAAAEHLDADLVLADLNAAGPLRSAAEQRGVHVRTVG